MNRIASLSLTGLLFAPLAAAQVYDFNGDPLHSTGGYTGSAGSPRTRIRGSGSTA
ncbi:MAG: hypothetical protein GY711_19795 [bacterium]|nr:hypothetical protein [bacterium]